MIFFLIKSTPEIFQTKTNNFSQSGRGVKTSVKLTTKSSNNLTSFEIQLDPFFLIKCQNDSMIKKWSEERVCFVTSLDIQMLIIWYNHTNHLHIQICLCPMFHCKTPQKNLFFTACLLRLCQLLSWLTNKLYNRLGNFLALSLSLSQVSWMPSHAVSHESNLTLST